MLVFHPYLHLFFLRQDCHLNLFFCSTQRNQCLYWFPLLFRHYKTVTCHCFVWQIYRYKAFYIICCYQSLSSGFKLSVDLLISSLSIFTSVGVSYGFGASINMSIDVILVLSPNIFFISVFTVVSRLLPNFLKSRKSWLFESKLRSPTFCWNLLFFFTLKKL